MDQGSKSSLKIVGVIALVAIVGAFGYSSMRKNSLEQSGRVYETPQISQDSPGCFSNVWLTPNGDGSYGCNEINSCDGSSTNAGGSVSSNELTGCLDGGSPSTNNNYSNDYYTQGQLGCLALACTSIEDSESLNQVPSKKSNDINIGGNLMYKDLPGCFNSITNTPDGCSMTSCSGNVSVSDGGYVSGNNCEGEVYNSDTLSYDSPPNTQEQMTCLALSCMGSTNSDSDIKASIKR